MFEGNICSEMVAGLKSTEACATGLFERLFMTHVWFDYLGQGVIFSRAIL